MPQVILSSDQEDLLAKPLIQMAAEVETYAPPYQQAWATLVLDLDRNNTWFPIEVLELAHKLDRT